MTKIIFESDLIELASFLSKEAAVYLPTLKNPKSTFSQCSFEKYSKEVVPEFDYSTSILPPKEFFLPPKDTLFKFEAGKTVKPEKAEKKVLFGVNLADLEAISRLNKIFSAPIEDTHYKNLSESIAVIGIDRFTPPKGVFFDLYLMKINNEVYAGFAATKKGRRILKNPLFKNKEIRVPAVKKNQDHLINHPDLAKIIEQSKKHQVWDDLAEICFGCGVCSYVCPMCYCFETEDKIDFGTESSPSGERLRTWDSCMLKSFADTNAGNFRPLLRDRIYNWYFHKFVRMPKEYGFSGCTDCNRCVIYCPAKINYHKTILTLITDWEKNKKK